MINRKFTDGVESSVNNRQHTNQIAAKIKILWSDMDMNAYRYHEEPMKYHQLKLHDESNTELLLDNIR